MAKVELDLDREFIQSVNLSPREETSDDAEEEEDIEITTKPKYKQIWIIFALCLFVTLSGGAIWYVLDKKRSKISKNSEEIATVIKIPEIPPKVEKVFTEEDFELIKRELKLLWDFKKELNSTISTFTKIFAEIAVCRRAYEDKNQKPIQELIQLEEEFLHLRGAISQIDMMLQTFMAEISKDNKIVLNEDEVKYIIKFLTQKQIEIDKLLAGFENVDFVQKKKDTKTENPSILWNTYIQSLLSIVIHEDVIKKKLEEMQKLSFEINTIFDSLKSFFDQTMQKVKATE